MTLFSVCLLAGTVLIAQQQDTPALSLQIDVELVELHVTVVDERGRPVGGLKEENFRVSEDRIDQPISVFKHEDIPVSLGLVLDNSRSIEPRKARLDAAALSFVERSNPEDETFIVHFDFDARLSQPFTRDRAALEETLSGAKPYGQTALYDSVMLALDSMEASTYSKKALLVVTDGIDNASKSTLNELVDRLKRGKVMVFTVGLLSMSGGVEAEDSLIQIADASGGRAYFPQTVEQARDQMHVIARDLREQYTLGYRPSNPIRDGGWRSVRVDVLPPRGFPSRLTTDYRHGYYAPDQKP